MHGVVAIELMTGRIETITAKAVILCTGGCGQVFPFTTNATIKTGDGMALAYRAGAPLKDMEFVQYHPTGLPFTGILITEAARAEGGWLLNKDGYRYLQDYDLGTPDAEARCCAAWSSGPRDRLSQAFVHELEKGRTIDIAVRPGRPPRPAAPGREDHRHEAAVRARAVPQYERIDPVTELIPVRPVVHYMMGGVHTDIDGATPLPGLYAAGETACVSINGANRLGSNSLPECWCSAPGPAARPPSTPPPRAAAPRRASRRRPPTSSAGSSATCCAAATGAEQHRRASATRCRR